MEVNYSRVLPATMRGATRSSRAAGRVGEHKVLRHNARRYNLILLLLDGAQRRRGGGLLLGAKGNVYQYQSIARHPADGKTPSFGEGVVGRGRRRFNPMISRRTDEVAADEAPAGRGLHRWTGISPLLIEHWGPWTSWSKL